MDIDWVLERTLRLGLAWLFGLGEMGFGYRLYPSLYLSKT
jgi:hypothetical protein